MELGQKKVWLVVVFVLLVAGGFGAWKYRDSLPFLNQFGQKPFDPSADENSFKTGEELDNFYKNLAEVYKKDTYGGETPEETLQLFIDALKKGDTDLAAKYFIPEKQKKEAEDLRIGKENNILGLIIGDIEKEKIGSAYSEGRYKFTTYDENNNAEFQFDLLFNSSTKVWKIESL